MADTNERVMAMVKEELARNPDASVSDLQDKATKLDASIGQLTTRQFHARYPLQVKRAKAAAKGGRGAGRKKATKKRATKKRAGTKRAAAKKTAAKKPAAKRGPAKRRGRPRKSATKKAAAKKTARRGGAAKKAASAGTRRGRSGESVKDVLVDFAGQLAGADTATDLVRVMGELDAWAERIDRASS
ncbi:MAG: hypothetical protein WEB88_16030 [Gemmatimonadota bacterium]